jgi:hypothetical protein
MSYSSISSRLSKYQNFILNKIIDNFETSTDFNIYDLVEKAVAARCILSSQNALVMDTFYIIKEQLLAVGLLTEQEEMVSYRLTDKRPGAEKLPLCGAI